MSVLQQLESAVYDPIRVHVTNPPEKPRTKEYRVTHRTFAPATNAPSQVCGYDPAMKEVRLSVITGPVVICKSQGQASEAANNTAGLANPSGRILPAGTSEIVIPGPNEMWIAAGANAQVGVTIVRCI